MIFHHKFIDDEHIERKMAINNLNVENKDSIYSGFIEIAHTADVAIEVRGIDLPDLFTNAMRGFSHILLHSAVDGKLVPIKFQLKEDSFEDLLVAFLTEYNFNFQSKRRYMKNINSIEIHQSKNKCNLLFKGQYVHLKPNLYHQAQEVKSVTYHKMDIIRKNNLYQTIIIFDI